MAEKIRKTMRTALEIVLVPLVMFSVLIVPATLGFSHSKNGAIWASEEHLSDVPLKSISYTSLSEDGGVFHSYAQESLDAAIEDGGTITLPVEENIDNKEFSANFFAAMDDVIFDNPEYSLFKTGKKPMSMVSRTSVDGKGILNKTVELRSEAYQDDVPQDDYKTVEASVKKSAEDAKRKSDGKTALYVMSVYRQLACNTDYVLDSQSIHSNDIYGALIEGESICYGLSCAMKAILDESNIQNYIAYGYVNETKESHAWNVIMIDGQWFVCDLTTGISQVADISNKDALNKIFDVAPIAIDVFFQGCLVKQSDYYKNVTPDERSVAVQEAFTSDIVTTDRNSMSD